MKVTPPTHLSVAILPWLNGQDPGHASKAPLLSPRLPRSPGPDSQDPAFKVVANPIAEDRSTHATGLPPVLHATLSIGAWILLSSLVILHNREIMRGAANFRYPLTLTSLHLAYQTVGTRLLHRYTNLVSGPALDPSSRYLEGTAPANFTKNEELAHKDASVAMSWGNWGSQIVPPAVLFSISLVLSNWAYLFLTSAFIQILKSISPVTMLLTAYAFRTRRFKLRDLVAVFLISVGVAMGGYGETQFNLIGFLIQLVAIIVEAVRITLLQILLQGGKMGSLKSLYFFAPICLGLNAALILPIEGLAALKAIPRLGFLTIMSNCTLTFLLNLSSAHLIGINSMVMSLSKVGKSVVMVYGSAVLLGEKITLVQTTGYGLAVIGLTWYGMQPK